MPNPDPDFLRLRALYLSSDPANQALARTMAEAMQHPIWPLMQACERYYSGAPVVASGQGYQFYFHTIAGLEARLAMLPLFAENLYRVLLTLDKPADCSGLRAVERVCSLRLCGRPSLPTLRADACDWCDFYQLQIEAQADLELVGSFARQCRCTVVEIACDGQLDWQAQLHHAAQVERIILRWNRLAADAERRLWADLARLPKLRRLELHFGAEARLPEGLDGLPQRLDLSLNGAWGERFSALTELEMPLPKFTSALSIKGFNQLTRFPSAIYGCLHLETLQICGEQLHDLPENRFPEMRYIHLSWVRRPEQSEPDWRREYDLATAQLVDRFASARAYMSQVVWL